MTARFPLVVEFLLGHARITGVVDLLEERKRLVDLLNSTEGVLQAANVQVVMNATSEPRRLESLAIAKSAILAAIPRETDEHNRVRALQRTVVGRTSTTKGRMAFFLPPLYVEGVAHGPGGAGRLKADPALFTHFFSVTDVDVVAPFGELHHMPIAVVNRDAIVALSLLEEVFQAGDPRSGPQPMERSLIEKLVAGL